MSQNNGAEGGIRTNNAPANIEQIDETGVFSRSLLTPENAGEGVGDMQRSTHAVQSIGEEWRPVPGFEGLYEVSDLGRVRNAISGRVLRPNTISRYGHKQVKLSKDKRTFDRLVHRLVLEAFVGPCPPGMYARHVYDPDPGNNALGNLMWGSPLENAADMFRHGNANPSRRKQNIRRRAERAERARLLRGSR